MLQLHQLPYDGQAQSGASVLPGDTRVGLAKAFKDGRKLFLWHANAGIRYDKLHIAFGFFLFLKGNLNADRPDMCKLDRIADKIDQNLVEPDGIANKDLVGIRVQHTLHLNPFFFRLN